VGDGKWAVRFWPTRNTEILPGTQTDLTTSEVILSKAKNLSI